MENQQTHILFGTEVQEIKLAQIVQDRDKNKYVVYEIYRHANGTDYKLIDIDTCEMCITQSIVPIKKYIGTGFCYDHNNIEYLPFEEVGRLLTQADNLPPTQSVAENNLRLELIDYSRKAIALFGDTKSIKDLLSAMGGKFNPRLTYHDRKKAGWIFSISKRNELNTILNLK